MSISKLKAVIADDDPVGIEGLDFDNATDDQVHDIRALQERNRRDNLERIDARIEAATPSTRLLLERIYPEVAPIALSREDRHTVIIAKVFSADWLSTAYYALKLAIRKAWAAPNADIYVMANDKIQIRTYHSLSLDIERLPEALKTGPVICLIGPDDEMPEHMQRLADGVIVITAPSVKEIARLLELDDIGDLADDSAARLKPIAIDLAVTRGRDAGDRLTILNSFLDVDDAKEVKQAKKPALKKTASSVRLEDLEGYGPSKAWGLQLIDDLASYRRGEIEWKDVDQGALLVGPPGTGKTLFAQALANSAHVTFIPTSYAEWQSTKEGHLGDVTKAIRKIFEKAEKDRPAVVFIDEIDALRGRGTDTRHESWYASVTLTLLECLDGIGRREGVVVLAACNDDSTLDAALVRSGRLDRRFVVDLPDEQALAGIFRQHLGEAVDNETIDRIATLYAGIFSGADVTRIVREARRKARLEKRAVHADDLIAVALPPETRSPAMVRRVALHEAGHAVAAMAFGRIPNCLSLVSTDGRHGSVNDAVDLENFEGLAGDIEKLAMVKLAGRAAEDVVLGSISAGAGGSAMSDLAQATRIVSSLESVYGLGATLTYRTDVDGAHVEREMTRLYKATLRLIERHRHAVEALAATAMEKRVLGRPALEAFAHQHDLVAKPSPVTGEVGGA